jgi:competence protein ComEC
LSFCSVALIIYGISGRLAPTGLWWKWGRIQWVIAVGLIPLSIGLFQACSFTSFMANSIAIPWVEFILVPLCLLGCFCLIFSAKLGGCILILADKLLGILWIILTWFAQLPHLVWYQVVPHTWMLISGVMGMVFLLLPKGMPGRYMGVIGLLPMMLFKPSMPKAGEVWLNLLDVGQGLSVVVQTQKHILVYDAGPKLGENYDMGESVVVPFLHSIGAKRVDMLVVSHGDNDHIGGTGAVLQQFPVTEIKTSVPQALPGAAYCLRGTAWEWEGVSFSFLYPSKDKLDLDNNSSCVLRITNGKKTLLLTGDIEKLAEKELVLNQKNNLPADILVAPHHGSKTSAQDDFLESVHPRIVLFAVGYRNRYHFPNSSVVEKYQDRQVIQYQADKTGAMQFVLNQQSDVISPHFYRWEHRHYWNN